MSTFSRYVLKVALCLALAGAVVIASLNQGKIRQLRAEQAASAVSDDASKQQQNQTAASSNAAAEEAEKLRDANRDLPKLRNEVTQLRRQAKDLDALRAENQRLQAEAAAPVKSETPTPVFMPKSALMDAGFATPEATIQTYLWAITQGNVQRFADCMVDPASETRNLSDPRALDYRKRSFQEQSKNFEGYQIAGMRSVPPDVVLVVVQARGMPGPDPQLLPLKRIGNEWKLGGYPN